MNADLTSDGRGDFSDQRSSYNLGRSAMPQLQIIILSERRKMIMSFSLTMSMRVMTVMRIAMGMAMMMAMMRLKRCGVACCVYWADPSPEY